MRTQRWISISKSNTSTSFDTRQLFAGAFFFSIAKRIFQVKINEQSRHSFPKTMAQQTLGADKTLSRAWSSMLNFLPVGLLTCTHQHVLSQKKAWVKEILSTHALSTFCLSIDHLIYRSSPRSTNAPTSFAFHPPVCIIQTQMMQFTLPIPPDPTPLDIHRNIPDRSLRHAVLLQRR